VPPAAPAKARGYDWALLAALRGDKYLAEDPLSKLFGMRACDGYSHLRGHPAIPTLNTHPPPPPPLLPQLPPMSTFVNTAPKRRSSIHSHTKSTEDERVESLRQSLEGFRDSFQALAAGETESKD